MSKEKKVQKKEKNDQKNQITIQYQKNIIQIICNLRQDEDIQQELGSLIKDIISIVNGTFSPLCIEVFVERIPTIVEILLDRSFIAKESKKDLVIFLRLCLCFAIKKIPETRIPLFRMITKIFSQDNVYGFYVKSTGSKDQNLLNEKDTYDSEYFLTHYANKKEKKDKVTNHQEKETNEKNPNIENQPKKFQFIQPHDEFKYLSKYLMINIERFAQMQGFESILKLISNKDFQLISTLTPILLEPLLTSRQLFSNEYLKILVDDINTIKEKIQNIEFEELRNIDLPLLIKIIEILQKIISPIQQEEFDRFEINLKFGLAIKMMNSTFLNLRVNGIEIISKIVKKMFFNHRYNEGKFETIVLVYRQSPFIPINEFSKWLKTINFLDLLFGNKQHSKIIERSGRVLKFLAMNGEFTTNYIDLIWKSLYGFHHSTNKILHKIIIKISKYLNNELLLYLYSTKIEKIKEWDQSSIKLLSDFGLSTIHKFPNSIEKFWDLLIDKQNKNDNIKMVTTVIYKNDYNDNDIFENNDINEIKIEIENENENENDIEIEKEDQNKSEDKNKNENQLNVILLKKFSTIISGYFMPKKLKVDLTNRCLQYFKEFKKIENVIPVFGSIIFSYHNNKTSYFNHEIDSVQSILETLEKDNSIISLIISEICNFKKQYNIEINKIKDNENIYINNNNDDDDNNNNNDNKQEEIKKENENEKNKEIEKENDQEQKLNKIKKKYLQGLKIRLNFLSDLFDSFDQDFTTSRIFLLKQTHIDKLWESLFENNNFLEQKNLFFKWFLNFQIPDEISMDLFFKIEQLDVTKMTVPIFEFYKKLIYKANSINFKIEGTSTRNFRVITLDRDELLGEDLLWEIILNCENENVINSAIKFLINLYHLSDELIDDNLANVRNLLTKKAIDSLMDNFNNNDDEINKELKLNRSIDILINFIDLIEKNVSIEDLPFQRHIHSINSEPIHLKITAKIETAMTPKDGETKIFECKYKKSNSIQFVRSTIAKELDFDEDSLFYNTEGDKLNYKNKDKTINEVDLKDNQEIMVIANYPIPYMENNNEKYEKEKLLKRELLPSFILSKYSEKLFSFLENSSLQLIQKIWELLLKLPTDEKQYSIIFNFFNNSNNETINNDDQNESKEIKLRNLFNLKSIYKLLYNLQIILGIIQLKNKKSKLWINDFLTNNGLKIIVSLQIDIINFIINKKNIFENKFIYLDCLNLILKLITVLINLKLTLANNTKRNLILNLMDLINDCSIDNNDNLKLINSQIALQSIQLINILNAPEIILEYQKMDQWLKNTLLTTINENISRSISNEFLKILKYTKNLNFHSFLFKKLILFFKKIEKDQNKLKNRSKFFFSLFLPILQENLINLTNENNEIIIKEISNIFYSCIKFIKNKQIIENWNNLNQINDQTLIGSIQILTILISYLNNSNLNINQIITHFNNKIEKNPEIIKNEKHKSKGNVKEKQNETEKKENEGKNENENENENPNKKDNQEKYKIEENLVEYLLNNCLFTFSKSSANSKKKNLLPKCKSNLSQDKTYQLLIELSKLSKENFLKILNRILFEINKIPKIDTWYYNSEENLRSNLGYAGLRNFGSTCYMNSLLQQLFQIPDFRDLLLNINVDEKKKTKDNIFYQMQLIFANMLHSRKKIVSTSGLIGAWRDWEGQPLNPRIQQDAGEFLSMLFDKLETELNNMENKNNENENESIGNKSNFLKELFGGETANQIIAINHPDVKSERIETFFNLQVDVTANGNLEDSFEKYIEGEKLIGENQYYSEQLEKKIDALKRCCLRKLPKNLIINLKRFKYDLIRGRRFKVNDKCTFPMKINLKKYTLEGIEELENQKKMKKNEQNVNKNQNKNKNQTEKNKNIINKYYDYELVGIIRHTGSSASGHYISFIKERDNVDEKDSWLKFDDRNVEKFNSKLIPEQCFGGKLDWQNSNWYNDSNKKNYSAYMLFYQRIDVKPSKKIFKKNDFQLTLKKQICQENSNFLLLQSFFTQNFFNFLFNLLNIKVNQLTTDTHTFTTNNKYIDNKNEDEVENENGNEKDKEFIQLKRNESDDEMLISIFDLSINFITNFLFHSTLKKDFSKWSKLLIQLMEKNNKCCISFFNYCLLDKDNWINNIFYDCPNIELWEQSPQLIINAFKILLVNNDISSGSNSNKVIPNNEIDLMKMDLNEMKKRTLLYDDIDFANLEKNALNGIYTQITQKMVNLPKFKPKSLSIQFLNKIITLFPPTSKEISNLPSYLFLISELILIGPLIREYLLNINFISALIDWYLIFDSPLRSNTNNNDPNYGNNFLIFGGMIMNTPFQSNYDNNYLINKLENLPIVLYNLLKFIKINDYFLPFEIQEDNTALNEKINIINKSINKTKDKLKQLEKDLKNLNVQLDVSNEKLQYYHHEMKKIPKPTSNKKRKKYIKSEEKRENEEKKKEEVNEKGNEGNEGNENENEKEKGNENENEKTKTEKENKANIEIDQEENTKKKEKEKNYEIKKKRYKIRKRMQNYKNKKNRIKSKIKAYERHQTRKNTNVKNWLNTIEKIQLDIANNDKFLISYNQNNLLTKQNLHIFKLDHYLLLKSNFLNKLISDGLNIQISGKILKQLCLNNILLFKKISNKVIQKIIDSQQRNLSKYFGILREFLLIEDQNNQNLWDNFNWLINYFVNEIQKNLQEYSIITNSLEFIKDVIKEQPHILTWFSNNKQLWLYDFLIDNASDKAREIALHIIKQIIGDSIKDINKSTIAKYNKKIQREKELKKEKIRKMEIDKKEEEKKQKEKEKEKEKEEKKENGKEKEEVNEKEKEKDIDLEKDNEKDNEIKNENGIKKEEKEEKIEEEMQTDKKKEEKKRNGKEREAENEALVIFKILLKFLSKIFYDNIYQDIDQEEEESFSSVRTANFFKFQQYFLCLQYYFEKKPILIAEFYKKFEYFWQILLAINEKRLRKDNNFQNAILLLKTCLINTKSTKSSKGNYGYKIMKNILTSKERSKELINFFIRVEYIDDNYTIFENTCLNWFQILNLLLSKSKKFENIFKTSKNLKYIIGKILIGTREKNNCSKIIIQWIKKFSKNHHSFRKRVQNILFESKYYYAPEGVILELLGYIIIDDQDKKNMCVHNYHENLTKIFLQKIQYLQTDLIYHSESKEKKIKEKIDEITQYFTKLNLVIDWLQNQELIKNNEKGSDKNENKNENENENGNENENENGNEKQNYNKSLNKNKNRERETIEWKTRDKLFAHLINFVILLSENLPNISILFFKYVKENLFHRISDIGIQKSLSLLSKEFQLIISDDNYNNSRKNVFCSSISYFMKIKENQFFIIKILNRGLKSEINKSRVNALRFCLIYMIMTLDSIEFNNVLNFQFIECIKKNPNEIKELSKKSEPEKYLIKTLTFLNRENIQNVWTQLCSFLSVYLQQMDALSFITNVFQPVLNNHILIAKKPSQELQSRLIAIHTILQFENFKILLITSIENLMEKLIQFQDHSNRWQNSHNINQLIEQIIGRLLG
ncbi:ubiquitin carboxyl-terminal hydrolase [Anaeramoeba flamelloides]|uniref:Ubiquitin carboxyl-terminal hydrolase n=1 Tax=Anaeramoeba flamelloides TaxID=1746091 RepID=A0AAV7ZM46_9EUKA|nr:ubiquitin carboxyl-terminal hydrolase [Anaeramoeba flamelloides]